MGMTLAGCERAVHVFCIEGVGRGFAGGTTGDVVPEGAEEGGAGDGGEAEAFG